MRLRVLRGGRDIKTGLLNPQALNRLSHYHGSGSGARLCGRGSGAARWWTAAGTAAARTCARRADTPRAARPVLPA